MDGKADRRKRLLTAFNWCLFVIFFAVLEFHSISSDFVFTYAVGNAYLIYLILVGNGLFSIYDMIGWFSSPGGGSSQGSPEESPDQLIVIPPDRRARVSHSVGIVLAGGGGKGAYQIGCWRAIQRRGLKIDAVSGTSIGALNAVVIARQEPALTDFIEYFWRHISASQLGRLDVMRLLFAPWTYATYRQRYKRDLPPLSVVPLIAAVAVLTLCLAWLLKSQIQWSRSSPSTYWITWLWVIVLVIYGLRLLMAGAMELGLIPMSPGVIFTGPAQRLVKQVTPEGTFIQSPCKCFITTAERRLLYDGDNPDHDRGTAHQWRTDRRFEPRIVYTPFYWPLDKVESEIGIRATRIALDISVALPILFQAYRIRDWLHFDGALADRLPIRPLLDYGCQRIFVIHLDATGRDILDGRSFDVLTREGLVAKLKWQERLTVC
jgi:patatin-like phospholipase